MLVNQKLNTKNSPNMVLRVTIALFGMMLKLPFLWKISVMDAFIKELVITDYAKMLILLTIQALEDISTKTNSKITLIIVNALPLL